MKNGYTCLMAMLLCAALMMPVTGSAAGMDLVGTLVDQLGVTPTQASGGAGAIFKLAKNNMSAGDFLKVTDALPEVTSLVGDAPAAAAPSADTGSMGDMAKMATGAASGMASDQSDAPLSMEKPQAAGMEAATEAATSSTEGAMAGAEAAAEQPAAMADAAGSGSGGLSGALGGVGKMLGGGGGSLGGIAGLAGSFSDLGMDVGMVQKFMPIVLDYAKSKGGDMVSGLLTSALQ